jgi:hypothetical protein
MTTLEGKTEARVSPLNNSLNRIAEVLINESLRRHGTLDISCLSQRDIAEIRRTEAYKKADSYSS